MKISYNWLKRRYLPELAVSPSQVAKVLPLLGFEVDEVVCVGLADLKNVIVGEVLSRDPHPSADRLSVCKVQVDAGGKEVLQIVCGAKNYTVGDRIPVALVGAVLPGEFTIKQAKLRGVTSNGMLCSAKEIGFLESENEGLLILQERPPIGMPINEVFPENDTVFTIELTPNRGDCASHLGIARELAAYYNLPCLALKSKDLPSSSNSEALIEHLEVKSNTAPYYAILSIKGVTVGPSPEWLQKDLIALGMRPVNNIVDITNWVMLDCGQPLHAFDAAKIKGKKIVVRDAQKDEKITTLDGKKHVLTVSDLVIADESRPLAIAGVMGSVVAEVDATTCDILLEAAYFRPEAIQLTARALNISTDSAYRFIRDVDPQNMLIALHCAAEMILEIAGGSLAKPYKVIGTPPRQSHRVKISSDFISQCFGFQIEENFVTDCFKRLGFSINAKENQVWSLSIPSFRPDLLRPIDLVEECIRLYGTENIPLAPVSFKALPQKEDPISQFNAKANTYLLSHSFNEVYNDTLRSEEEMKLFFDEVCSAYNALENPLTSSHTHFRPSLIPGLLNTLEYNMSHGNFTNRFFETGHVLCPISNKAAYEAVSVAFVVSEEQANRHWLNRPLPDFYFVKNLIVEVAKITGIDLGSYLFEWVVGSKLWQEKHAACIGKLENDGFSINCGVLCLKTTKKYGFNEPVLAAEFNILPKLLKPNEETRQLSFKPFSIYPRIRKDLALIMEIDLPAEKVRRDIFALATSEAAKYESIFIENVSIFDLYTGQEMKQDFKSIAFTICFYSPSKTLKDSEVMPLFEAIQVQLERDSRYTLRNLGSG